MAQTPTLARKLGTFDAVAIGLGSMIGAGIFAVFAPAAQVAGGGLLLGLALAAFIAYCNATSSAQLAAQYPESGGTYIYGRQRLGKLWGFLAGWGFVLGKTASCAAMALTFASYALPGVWQKPVAMGSVLLLAAVNYRGVTRTAKMTKAIVAVSLTALILVLLTIWLGGQQHLQALPYLGTDTSLYGILQSAGLLFFAFAGYARIATMGEEVRDPARTIPRAIVLALGIAVLLYGLVALTLLTHLGIGATAASAAPLMSLAQTHSTWLALPVRIAAVAASLGALLALMTGIGRTSLAMARNQDLPASLAAIHPKYQVPHRAEVLLALLVCLLIVLVDLRGALGFSSFGVLIYYFIANLAAWTQERSFRRFPRFLQLLGSIGCALLVLSLPWQAVVGGSVLFGAGLIYYFCKPRKTYLQKN